MVATLANVGGCAGVRWGVLWLAVLVEVSQRVFRQIALEDRCGRIAEHNV